LLTLRHNTYLFSVTALAVFFLAGCSAEKNTGSSRFYHALISKYNIYFNGNESYKKGVEKVRAANRDDYTNLLPVFEYSSPESAGACAGEMERAVQKASKVIALHSITAKPEKKENRGDASDKDEEFLKQKEYNVWVDDSYLLMAKAQFYQKKYTEARTTISYLRDISTDQDLLNEASIWYSRILIEEKSYSLAENTLKEMPGQESFNPALKAMYSSTWAELLLRQKKYAEAIAHLETAVRYSPNKETKVRLTYLLAQVCQKEGDDILSTKYFREVIHMKPPYEFEFNAGINLAGVADISSDDDIAELKKVLIKMLGDVKNKEYLDQIYYALGDLARRQGNMNDALTSFRMSASMSTGNMRQKGRSYLALGSYYYSIPDYVSAQHYYDSASVVIDENYPDYKTIKEKSDNLEEFIRFHNIIVREDSLLMVAAMTPQQRDVLVQKIIKEVKDKQAAEMMSGTGDMSNMGRSYENEQRYQENITQEGNWYFYNQTAMTFGRTEFKRRWGDRKLEDNWRRKNKARVAIIVDEEEATVANGQGKQGKDGKVPDNQTTEYYLKNLPLNDSLKALSIDKSTTARMNEGKVLASLLGDTLRAVKSMESALIPGASEETRAETLYHLYMLQKNINPSAATERYNQLINDYPGSEFAKILSDPDYVKKQAETAGMASAMYNNAYYSYKQSSYNEVVNICNEALEMFPEHELAPKFMLLRAIATGGLTGEFEYKNALDTIVKKYPGTPEGERAKEIIAFLKKEKPQIQIIENTKIAESIYSADASQPHFVLIIASNPSANLNQIVFDIINYNLDNFQSKNYRTEGAAEQGEYLMITVSGFKDAGEADEYIKNFDTSAIIRGAEEARLSKYIISRDNLDRFRTDKSPERYRIFYDMNYPVK